MPKTRRLRRKSKRGRRTKTRRVSKANQRGGDEKCTLVITSLNQLDKAIKETNRKNDRLTSNPYYSFKSTSFISDISYKYSTNPEDNDDTDTDDDDDYYPNERWGNNNGGGGIAPINFGYIFSLFDFKPLIDNYEKLQKYNLTLEDFLNNQLKSNDYKVFLEGLKETIAECTDTDTDTDIKILSEILKFIKQMLNYIIVLQYSNKPGFFSSYRETMYPISKFFFNYKSYEHHGRTIDVATQLTEFYYGYKYLDNNEPMDNNDILDYILNLTHIRDLNYKEFKKLDVLKEAISKLSEDEKNKIREVMRPQIYNELANQLTELINVVENRINKEMDIKIKETSEKQKNQRDNEYDTKLAEVGKNINNKYNSNFTQVKKAESMNKYDSELAKVEEKRAQAFNEGGKVNIVSSEFSDLFKRGTILINNTSQITIQLDAESNV